MGKAWSKRKKMLRSYFRKSCGTDCTFRLSSTEESTVQLEDLGYKKAQSINRLGWNLVYRRLSCNSARKNLRCLTFECLVVSKIQELSGSLIHLASQMSVLIRDLQVLLSLNLLGWLRNLKSRRSSCTILFELNMHQERPWFSFIAPPPNYSSVSTRLCSSMSLRKLIKAYLIRPKAVLMLTLVSSAISLKLISE